MQKTEQKAKAWEENKLNLDNAINISCTNFNDAGITSEMVVEAKVIRLSEIVIDLRKTFAELEEIYATKHTPIGVGGNKACNN